MNKYSLKINGKIYRVEADGNTPLLWILRDELDLVGTKYGCGIGQCGACTVHVDDVATRSCSLPISAIEYSSITTIEGLSEDNSHPVQKAWKEEDVPQCGYCQSGQMMTAASFIKNNNTPTSDEVRQAMHGNICRCAAYTRIEKAVSLAAKISKNEKL